MSSSNVDDLTKLKDLVISHVAKDVLMLTENVDDLKEKTVEITALLKQVNESSEGYFDNLAKKLVELLAEMESELAKVAEARVNQITMTVSDNVEKLLNEKFQTYQKTVDKGLESFNEVNGLAIDKLKSEWKTASKTINTLGNADPKAAANKYAGGKLVIVAIALQTVTLAAVAASFVF